MTHNFPCGHPRTKDNMVYRDQMTRVTCKECRRVAREMGRELPHMELGPPCPRCCLRGEHECLPSAAEVATRRYVDGNAVEGHHRGSLRTDRGT